MPLVFVLQRGRRPSAETAPSAEIEHVARSMLQRGRRPSSAETPGPVVSARRRARASTWPPTVVGGDPQEPGRERRRCGVASTWPPTVVGGDFRVSVHDRYRCQLQRGRRPSSAETTVGCSRVSPGCVLQRGRRPSSAETHDDLAIAVRIDPLQRGRRPSSAETARCGTALNPRTLGFNVAADRRRRRQTIQDGTGVQPSASTWPPTVVGGDKKKPDPSQTIQDGFNVAADRRRRRRRLAHPLPHSRARFNVAADRRRRRPALGERAPRRRAHASTWPPTVVGGDGRLDQRPDARPRASTWPPTVVGGDATTWTPGATDDSALQRGRRPSSAETSRRDPRPRCPRWLQRGRRPSSAETSARRTRATSTSARFNVAADRRRRRRNGARRSPSRP